MNTQTDLPVAPVRTITPMVAQHNADVPIVLPYDPLLLPATISFNVTGDGYGIESWPFSDAASATWWRESGPAALAPYSADALAMLRQVADATGHPLLGTALDVINDPATPAAVREFLYASVATVWAEAAEGYRLLASTDTTCSMLYDWSTRATQHHEAAAQAVHDQSALAALNQTIAGGETVYSVLAALPQFAEQVGSFCLDMTIPGLPVNGGPRIDVVLGGVAQDTIQTGAGCDLVMGFEGNDVILAGDGCDRLCGGLGDDRIDGGAGIDTAMYMGTRAEYVVAPTADGFTVSGPEGTDTLLGVERLQFRDTALALDVQGNAGMAYRLYGLLDRAPDPGGLGYHMHALDSGATLQDIAASFIDSPEFQARYGTTDNAQFVTLLYANVLHRAPDPDGFAYHLALLEAGVARANVLTGFTESPECQAMLIGTVQDGMPYIG